MTESRWKRDLKTATLESNRSAAQWWNAKFQKVRVLNHLCDLEQMIREVDPKAANTLRECGDYWETHATAALAVLEDRRRVAAHRVQVLERIWRREREAEAERGA